MGNVFSPSFDVTSAGAGPELSRRLQGFNAQVTGAVDSLTERTDALGRRVVSVEADLRELSDGARSVIGQTIREARAEFEGLRGAATMQQSAMLQEATDVRQAFSDTRQAIEDLYSRAATEFAGVRTWSAQAEQAMGALGVASSAQQRAMAEMRAALHEQQQHLDYLTNRMLPQPAAAPHA